MTIVPIILFSQLTEMKWNGTSQNKDGPPTPPSRGITWKDCGPHSPCTSQIIETGRGRTCQICYNPLICPSRGCVETTMDRTHTTHTQSPPIKKKRNGLI